MFIKKFFEYFFGNLRKEIYILFIGRLVTAMGSFVWPMLTFFLTAKLGYSDDYTATVLAVCTICSLPASIIGGKLTDKFGRKKIIIIFDILTVVLYLYAATIPQSFTTVIVIFIAGLFQTAESPAYDALIADFTASSQRDKAYSLTYFGFNFGFVLGAAISGLLFKDFFYLAFCINAIVILISTILISIFIFEKNSIKNSSDQTKEAIGVYETGLDENINVFKALKGRGVIYITILASCLGAIIYNIVTFIVPLQLKSSLGEDGAAIYGFLSSFNGLTVILFTPILTLFTKRVYDIIRMLLSIVLFMISLILFGFIPGIIIIMFVAEFVFTIGEILSSISRSPYFSRRIPISHRGRVYGLVAVFYVIFGSLSQFITGYILKVTNNNYQIVWSIYIGVSLITILLLYINYLKDKKRFPDLYK